MRRTYWIGRIVALLVIPALAGDAFIPACAAAFGKQEAAILLDPAYAHFGYRISSLELQSDLRYSEFKMISTQALMIRAVPFTHGQVGDKLLRFWTRLKQWTIQTNGRIPHHEHIDIPSGVGKLQHGAPNFLVSLGLNGWGWIGVGIAAGTTLLILWHRISQYTRYRVTPPDHYFYALLNALNTTLMSKTGRLIIHCNWLQWPLIRVIKPDRDILIHVAGRPIRLLVTYHSGVASYYQTRQELIHLDLSFIEVPVNDFLTVMSEFAEAAGQPRSEYPPFLQKLQMAVPIDMAVKATQLDGHQIFLRLLPMFLLEELGHAKDLVFLSSLFWKGILPESYLQGDFRSWYASSPVSQRFNQFMEYLGYGRRLICSEAKDDQIYALITVLTSAAVADGTLKDSSDSKESSPDEVHNVAALWFRDALMQHFRIEGTVEESSAELIRRLAGMSLEQSRIEVMAALQATTTWPILGDELPSITLDGLLISPPSLLVILNQIYEGIMNTAEKALKEDEPAPHVAQPVEASA